MIIFFNGEKSLFGAFILHEWIANQLFELLHFQCRKSLCYRISIEFWNGSSSYWFNTCHSQWAKTWKKVYLGWTIHHFVCLNSKAKINVFWKMFQVKGRSPRSVEKFQKTLIRNFFSRFSSLCMYRFLFKKNAGKEWIMRRSKY